MYTAQLVAFVDSIRVGYLIVRMCGTNIEILTHPGFQIVAF